MPRRRALTKAQIENLLALPVTEADLVRHWTLGDDDLALVDLRRRIHNQLGFALQLCALRYLRRLLRPGEIIPQPALRFVADQLGAAPEVLTTYAVRFQTRYEQLGALRTALGFTDLSPQRREILEWLLPVSLATTNPFTVATALLEDLRRRRIIVPGPSIVERLVATALASAEQHVANQLTGGLSLAQSEALDALLAAKPDTAMSVLAWARLPAGAPGHTALKRLTEQLACLRAVGLHPTSADGIHAEGLRKLAREGGRFTAQHLRHLSPLRRRATLVATVLDTIVRLTDDCAVGRMFRRAEVRQDDALLRDARAINDKVRLLAKLGTALLKAKAGDAGLDGAFATASVRPPAWSIVCGRATKAGRDHEIFVAVLGRHCRQTPPGQIGVAAGNMGFLSRFREDQKATGGRPIEWRPDV